MGLFDTVVKKAKKFEEKHDDVSMKAQRMSDEQLKRAYKVSVQSGRTFEKVVYKRELESRGYSLND